MTPHSSSPLLQCCGLVALVDVAVAVAAADAAAVAVLGSWWTSQLCPPMRPAERY